MSLFSTLLLVLGLLWLLQILGTWFQMRHYKEVLSGITRAGTEGYVGVGNARARFGKGVILILVSGEDGYVTRALRMRGRTVFARFAELPELVGKHLDELRDEGQAARNEAATMLAARKAVEQIDRIRAEREVNVEAR